MTNSVSLLGLFAPVPGARDAKVNEDNVLASFAGVLAGVNQANAKLLVPTPPPEVATNGDTLENPEEPSDAIPADSKKADDVTDAARASAHDTTASPVPALPLAINSSLAALNPALQEKLARVISRMREETGHDVQVTETFRSQARQNALYAQGRETTGPVVTWTQSSKHTLGRAVDVTLDAGRAGADAYTALQRIANEEGLRTLGTRDPGHLELPSSAAVSSQASTDVTSARDESADTSGPAQVSVGRFAEIAKLATVEQVTTVGTGAAHEARLSPTTYMKAIKASDANVATPATIARVATVAQVAAVASVGTGKVTRGVRANETNGNARIISHLTEHADGAQSAKPSVPAKQAMNATNTRVDAEADVPANAPASVDDTANVASSNPSAADVAEATVDTNSLTPLPSDKAASVDQGPARPTHRQFEISNLDRLSDAVNATRVEDGSAEPKSSAAKSADKTGAVPNDNGIARARMAPRAGVVGAHAGVGQQGRAGPSNAKTQDASPTSAQIAAPTIGRSGNSSGNLAGDRGQSSDRDATGYTAMNLRSETTSQFSVAETSTEVASTASQRAERIMAAQDAPARPLSQIVMSVDAGNGTTDRIQVALRGSTVSATIDAADHHAANAMRSHSDELVRSLTRDGVDVESLRVRSTAPATAAPLTTIDSSQKSSDSSGNSRFNREAQWDQQRSQQRSNSERRHQQRDERGGRES